MSKIKLLWNSSDLYQRNFKKNLTALLLLYFVIIYKLVFCYVYELF